MAVVGVSQQSMSWFQHLIHDRSSSRDVRLGAAWQRGAFEDKLSMSSGSDTCADD